MTEVWMGYTSVTRAKEEAHLTVTGNRQLATSLQIWLGTSRFAKMDKFVA